MVIQDKLCVVLPTERGTVRDKTFQGNKACLFSGSTFRKSLVSSHPEL